MDKFEQNCTFIMFSPQWHFLKELALRDRQCFRTEYVRDLIYTAVRLSEEGTPMDLDRAPFKPYGRDALSFEPNHALQRIDGIMTTCEVSMRTGLITNQDIYGAIAARNARVAAGKK